MVNETRNLLDINVPVLAPTKTTKVKSLKSMVKNVYDAVRKRTRGFADWILGYVPESIKKLVNEKAEALKQHASDIFKKSYAQSFEIRESISALKGLTKRYTIDGCEGIGAQSFLDANR